MRIPRTLKVRNTTYRVRFVKAIHADGRIGEFDHDAREIKIKKGLSPRERQTVFLHEWLHAVECNLRTRIPHSMIYLIADHLERGLHANGLTIVPKAKNGESRV